MQDNPSVSTIHDKTVQKDSVAKKKSGGKSAQSVGGQNCKVKGTKEEGSQGTHLLQS